MFDLNKILEEKMWEELAKEGIEPYIVDMVDLELGDDVVEDESHGVCKTQRTAGGDYILVDFDNPSIPLEPHAISPKSLKILRARYLVNRGRYSTELSSLPNGERQRISHLYNLDPGINSLLEKLRDLSK